MQTPTDLVYIEQRPRQRAAGTPPLLVLLHGFGSNEHDLMGLAPALDPRFHLVALRAPQRMDFGGYAWFALQQTATGLSYDAAQAETVREVLVDTIPGLVAATGTDPARVYVLGFSQGAVLALVLGLFDPTSVAGVVALSSPTPPDLHDRLGLPVDLARLHIFLGHGLHDPLLPIAGAHTTRALLESLPVHLTYREYPMAHEITPPALADVAAWLTARLDAPLVEGGD